MTALPDGIQASPLDSKRFAIRAFRATVDGPERARTAIEFLRSGAADLVVARCPTSALPAVHALEGAGFLLMDTLVYFRRALVGAPPWPDEVRPVVEADEPRVEAIARAAFADYSGHYHVDPRLPKDASTEGYVEWALSMCRSKAHDVLVVERGGAVVGFLAIAWVSASTADIALNAVAPEAQGRGAYDALVKAAIALALRRGRTEIIVSTQIHNVAPQKVWSRNGFEPGPSFHTFHAWWAALRASRQPHRGAVPPDSPQPRGGTAIQSSVDRLNGLDAEPRSSARSTRSPFASMYAGSPRR